MCIISYRCKRVGSMDMPATPRRKPLVSNNIIKNARIHLTWDRAPVCSFLINQKGRSSVALTAGGTGAAGAAVAAAGAA